MHRKLTGTRNVSQSSFGTFIEKYKIEIDLKIVLLIIGVFYCSLTFGQAAPASGKYCIDVVKSDNGKYYALYSDNTWEESTYATAEVFKTVNKRNNAPVRNNSAANTYGIASSSPTKTTTASTSSGRTGSSSRTTTATRKSTSRTYIRGHIGHVADFFWRQGNLLISESGTNQTVNHCCLKSSDIDDD